MSARERMHAVSHPFQTGCSGFTPLLLKFKSVPSPLIATWSKCEYSKNTNLIIGIDEL
uniref:Uncharacterized protein n=1 Tax=Anguilla anguilla TaxID=7936 RepID=A0A0E9R7Q6_ANGAN